MMIMTHCELYTAVSLGAEKASSVVCSTHAGRLVVLHDYDDNDDNDDDDDDDDDNGDDDGDE